MAVFISPLILVGLVGKNNRVGQRVELQGGVGLPVDGPGGQGQGAQVTLRQERGHQRLGRVRVRRLLVLLDEGMALHFAQEVLTEKHKLLGVHP
eukprot:CAMPEP_0194582638 /NCGR_PEP_ID=MMETSP0292-20121207/15750_1 /TAXON_ID=39354 /ORGANISM="Heterosigma akashiwo, Strain CCMP2393" /LENGTH=93 /DNA_ID=CAMNT_0039436881 /DNA_START=179 /DNA_END=460 /DNA_ORIENTATION=-